MSRYYEKSYAPPQYYPFIKGDSDSLLTIRFNTCLTFNWTNITTAIFTSQRSYSTLNGSRVVQGSKYNLSQTVMEPNRLMQLINFYYDTADEGFYIQQLYSTIFTVDNILLDNGYECFDLLHYVAVYLGLQLTSLITFPFILSTYSMYKCIAKILIDSC